MKYTLHILYHKGRASKPKYLQVSLATTNEGYIVASTDGEFIDTSIKNPVIHMGKDGILISGYEDGSVKGAYYEQRWWLTEPEVEK